MSLRRRPKLLDHVYNLLFVEVWNGGGRGTVDDALDGSGPHQWYMMPIVRCGWAGGGAVLQ